MLAVLAASCSSPGKSGTGPDGDGGSGAIDRTRALWKMPNPPGDDAPNPARYELSGSGALATDQTTGLSWQRVADQGPGEGGGFVSADAGTHCEALALEGHDDFRLPTRIELVSLVNYTKMDAALDPDVFPGEPSEAYWSASVVPGDAEQRFHVNFFFGYTSSNLTVYAQWVRCVRTDHAPPASAREPLVIDADTVSDPATGLVWQRAADATPVTFDEAARRCAALSLAGSSGFRVPTMKELQTLVSERPAGALLIDEVAFPDVADEVVWSSSKLAGDVASAWLVRFSDGYSLYATLDTLGLVRCVL